MGRASVLRRWLLGLAVLSFFGSVAACGGEFEFQVGREESGTRAGGSGIEQGAPAPSHDSLLQLQEDYAKKLEAAKAAKESG